MPTMGPEVAQFVGVWRLISQMAQHRDGSHSYPRGENPFGLLIYEASGVMMVQLARADYGVTGGENRLNDYKSAMSNFLAYCGTYTVDAEAGIVAHRVESCSYPGWIGTTQIRRYAFNEEGARLTLSGDGKNADGSPEVRVLLWRRA